MPDQPIFAPLAYSGNPTLAPLANLPPDTQQALQDHGNRLLATPPPGTSVGPSVEQPPATLRPLGAAPDSNVLQIKAMKPMAVAASQPPPLAPTPHQQELARLTAPAPADASLKHTKANTGAAGESQIHNPLLRGLATAGDIALSTFAPVASMLTPGTQFHHQMLVGNARGAVSEDEGELNAKSKRELEEAQAAEQRSLPELHSTQTDLAKSRLNEKETSDRANEAIKTGQAESLKAVRDAQINARLAEHGMKKDPETGEIVPQKYEEMSEPLQAVHDLKAAQTEETQAVAALKKAQTDNVPAAAALAQQRLASAQQAHQIAIRRLGLSEEQTESRLFGTHNGVPLAATMITDSNMPVGSAYQQNVRPTGQERNKADLANSAHQQLGDLKDIVARRPDVFDPMNGRKTDFTVWLGSQDPDAQRFRAARTIAADHLAGVFGGRSEAALQALDAAIGHFKDNPKAILAGLDQLDKANTGFVKAGTVRSTGSNAAAAANVDPAVKAYADKYFGGDVTKAQDAIEKQKKK